MSKLIRQGDVLLIPVRNVKPENIEEAPADARGIVLAEGDTSLHYHAVFGPKTKLFQYRDGRSDRVLRIDDSDAEVRVVGGGSGVDRHVAVSLMPGSYIVRIQREWDSSLARSVRGED
jgi:hypothetical protein